MVGFRGSTKAFFNVFKASLRPSLGRVPRAAFSLTCIR
jgi:hypothetical protein